MITNFKNLEHLEYHAGKSSAYEKMIMAENILVNASTRTEYIEAIGSMRGVLEQILKEVLPAIGVTDAMILAAKPEVPRLVC